MRHCLLLGSLALFSVPLGANPIEVGGMSVSWDHRANGIEFHVVAPTLGWVAIGFNDVDNIVGADLIMARVQGGQSEARHLYVVAAGDPRPVESLGRPSIIQESDGRHRRGATEIRLRLDHAFGSGRSLNLTRGATLYVIVAYSESPDFDHHSRMRQHVLVEL